ncbi:MAG: polysaccharide lyase [Candidatus Hydrogenedentes bacterium]|nr:polysaccharide lyase [Candidatus Hydrogenedentota bacterium]
MFARTTVIAVLFLLPVSLHAATPAEAVQGLRKAIGFFRESVAVEGGYVWKYSADLNKREGEGRATPTQIWVQPPSTPSVGEALLAAYDATGDAYYLDAARETALALVRGQLASGGWDYKIDFDPAKRKGYAYKSDGANGKTNTTTLDDNTTQAALSFLIHIDQALAKSDQPIHDAVVYALDKLIAAQYPNGAWPQRFAEAPDASKYPVIKASYPESWAREWAARDYKSDYTFNDNSIADMIELMLLAHNAYDDTRFRDAALRGGDFILLAQMPDPQPGWAQQYDAAMHPVWARKFEPPAITGNESQGVMRTLIDLFDKTGQKRFLLPIPRAIAYYKASLLPDGRLARFYELQTNKPLYFTKDYKLTYSSDDMPTHYGFIVGSGLDGIQAEYDRAIAEGAKTRTSHQEGNIDSAKIDAIVQALDSRSAWVDSDKLDYHGDDDPTREIISSATFARNVRTLSTFIKQSKNTKDK